MIKIIVCFVVAIASVFSIIPNISSTYADAIEGNPGIDNVLSSINYFYLKNNSTDNITFQTSDYNAGTLTNTFGYANTNTLTADFGASLDYTYNSGWQYIVNNTSTAGVIRKSQVYNSISTASQDMLYSTQYSWYASITPIYWSGVVSFQLPLYVWTQNRSDTLINETPISIPSNFYGTVTGYYRNDGVSNSLTFTRTVKDNYIYFDAEIPDGTLLTSLSLYYWFNFNSKILEVTDMGYVRYLFTNITFDNSHNAGYNIGYQAGYEAGINNVNPNTNNYQAGYNAGVEYQKNTVDTTSASYNAGFNAGQNAGDTFYDMVVSVLDAPVQVFLDTFNFEVFGVNVSNIILSLFTLAIITFIIKLLI